MRRSPVLVALLLLGVTHVAAHAQSDVMLSASVPVASPTGAGSRNLSFGTITVTPGATQNIAVTAAAAAQSATMASGEYRFDVGSAAGLDMQITLPTALISSVGNVPLAISFNGTQYGGHCIVLGASGCTLTTFNPSTTTTLKVCNEYKGNGDCKNKVWTPGSQLRLYVGGVLTVPPTQVAATYTATITLQITQVY